MQVDTRLHHREVVLGEVASDEPLHGTFADGTVAQHRRRHDVKAEGLAHSIGRHLTTVQSGLEIPEWSLAPHWLVDRRVRLALVGDVDEKRGVAAVRHSPFDFDLAEEQVRHGVLDIVDAQLDALLTACLVVRFVVVDDVVVQIVARHVGQFMRGQACPSGSIG